MLAAAVTWGLSFLGVLILPLVAGLETGRAADAAVDAPVDMPAVGGIRWWAVLAVVTLAAAAVAWARTRPVGALLTVGALVLLLGATRPGDASGAANIAVVVTVYRAVAAHPFARVRAAVAAAAVLAAAGLALAGTPPEGPTVAAVGAAAGSAAVVVGVGLVAGLWVASRRALAAARAGEVAALVREQDALLRSAVAAERTAMAREVHDIAAHHLSGMALMLSAIDVQVDSDPAAAHAGVRQVREQSRRVLTDLRRLVGILREDGTPEASGPLTLAAVRELVEAGPASLEVRTGPGAAVPGAVLGAGLGPVAQLAGYRMVQESLANARRHAPGAACAVTVDDRAADAVVLTVRNGAPPAPSSASAASAAASSASSDLPQGGHGLLGMRERAELAGATLRYGPTPDGGWEVRLRLPRDPDPVIDAAAPTPEEGPR